jgi:hypothetical protein
VVPQKKSVLIRSVIRVNPWQSRFSANAAKRWTKFERHRRPDFNTGSYGFATDFHGFNNGSTRIKHWRNYPSRVSCCSPNKKIRVHPFCYPGHPWQSRFIANAAKRWTKIERHRRPDFNTGSYGFATDFHGFNKGLTWIKHWGNYPSRVSCCSPKKKSEFIRSVIRVIRGKAVLLQTPQSDGPKSSATVDRISILGLTALPRIFTD